jgi:hypothetical protein
MSSLQNLSKLPMVQFSQKFGNGQVQYDCIDALHNNVAEVLNAQNNPLSTQRLTFVKDFR